MRPLLALIVAAALSGAMPQASPAAETAVRQAGAPAGTLLNRHRERMGLGALRRDPRLDRAAAAHAADMARHGYFSHRDRRGRGHGARLAAAGYRSCGAAENIAWGMRDEAQVMTAWMGSPGHRRTMLLSRVTEYGLGRAGDRWVLVVARGC